MIEQMNAALHLALCDSILEARRFISRAQDAVEILENDEYAWTGRKETGAAKRASMDLTRSLVSVRNTNV